MATIDVDYWLGHIHGITLVVAWVIIGILVAIDIYLCIPVGRRRVFRAARHRSHQRRCMTPRH
jgi:hypothetical protein